MLTAVGGVVLVHGLAAVLPPASPGAPPPAAPLTLTILFVSLAFAVAQAILPGPRSSGCFGLAIPMAGAVALAARGVEPASVVSALFVGTFITPAAYYLAIRLSFALAGFLRRHPLAAVFMAAAGMLLVVETAPRRHVPRRPIDRRAVLVERGHQPPAGDDYPLATDHWPLL